MRLWQDAIMALLAAIGLTSLLWIIVRTIFFRPVTLPRALVLICARGDGEGIEQQVRELSLLRRERGAVGEILLVDCGLSEEGKHLCRILSRAERSVTLCNIEEIDKYIT